MPSERPSKIEFEQQYEDGSGPRIAVRYDVSQREDWRVELKAVGGEVSFAVSDIDWLRAVLWRIKEEAPKESDNPQ